MSLAKHATKRDPKPRGMGFSWGRMPDPDSGAVAYRLFRRDHRRAIHMAVVVITPDQSLADAAKVLRRAFHKLRDKVDDIDLEAMGVAA